MSALFRTLARLANLTSTPTSPSPGDTWWRSDLGQLHASDGLAGAPVTVGPTGTHPVIRATGWHPVPASGVTSTQVLPTGRLYALPFWPGRGCAVTDVTVDLSVAVLAAMRAGIYLDDGAGLPGARLADFGTITTSLLGPATWGALSQTLRPVLHWICVVLSSGTATAAVRVTAHPMVAQPTNTTLIAQHNAYYRDSITGALPDPFGTIAGSVQSPALLLRCS